MKRQTDRKKTDKQVNLCKEMVNWTRLEVVVKVSMERLTVVVGGCVSAYCSFIVVAVD